MENNKKYWFFGSKLNTALLFILIILMIMALRFMYTGKPTYFPKTQIQNESYTNNITPNPKTEQTEKINWVSSPSSFGNVISYPSDWQITPQYYGSPVMMANGGKASLVGYSFTLPSGAMIVWGGPQSSCIDSEFGVFEYGVSAHTCLKNLRTSIGYASARKTLLPSDLKLFGDFVLKNK